MSSYVVYFELPKNGPPGDFRLFKKVNKFSLPSPLVGEPCRVNIGGRVKIGQLITYGGNAPPFFSFGKNYDGQNGRKLRGLLMEFIRGRLDIQTIQPMLALVLVDGDFNHDLHPDSPPLEMTLADLSSHFVGEKQYNRLFLITD